jgi:Tfp pilus assembly PilM family ATPase
MAERMASNQASRKWPDWPFGQKLNVRRPGPVTALDIEGQVLRIAQTAPRGNGTAVTRVAVGQLEMPADADRSDPAIIGQAIGRALAGARVRPGVVVMGVPRQSVVLRTLSLPAIENIRELASMVHMQIGKDLPFRQEEAVIDFKVRSQVEGQLPPEESGAAGEAVSSSAGGAAASPARVEVLVAAVRRDTVDFYQRVAGAAKVKLAALGWL